VTGGAGFIGSEIATQLCSFGSEVTVFDDFSSGKMEYLGSAPSVKIVKGDICDREQVASALRDQEVVIHLAALPFIPDSYYHPEDFFRVNTMGSVNMVWQSIQSESVECFAHVSTSEVYGTAKYVPMDENHPTLPHSTYAVSKLAADRAVFTMHKEHSYPVHILRPFNSYGPRVTQPYIVPEIATQLLNGRTALELGDVHAVRDFTYVEDTARAIILASIEKQAVGEVINIGSGKGVRISELVALMAKILGKQVNIRIDESRIRPFDVSELICDSSKARRILNWAPTTSLDEGLKRTLDWLRSHPVRYARAFTGWAGVYRRSRTQVQT
jgi:dTDP-glucose 4,6-dehydratase